MMPITSVTQINEYTNYEIAFKAFMKQLDDVKNEAVAETATTYSDLFNVDAAFFFYAMDFGLEVAMEYWVNTTQKQNDLIYQNITNAFKKKCEEEITTE